MMENLPRDLPFTSESRGQLSFGLDESLITPDTNTCIMTNFESNSESLLSSSILSRSGYASVLSYNLPGSGGTFTELKSKATYDAETPTRMYPPRLHPGRSPLAFPQGTIPQHGMSLGWAMPSVGLHPSSMLTANVNTIPCTRQDAPLSQLDMHSPLISPLTGNFSISLPSRPFENREMSLPVPWIPTLPSLHVRSPQCSNNLTLSQNSMLVGDEKSTSPSNRVTSTINVSEFLNLPSQFERSFTNGVASSSKNLQTLSADMCSTPPVYSDVTMMSHVAHSSKFMMADDRNASQLTQLSSSHAQRNADSQDRVSETVVTTSLADQTSTKATTTLIGSDEFDYSKTEACDKSPRITVTESKATGQSGKTGQQDMPGQCGNTTPEERPHIGKDGCSFSTQLWYDCKSKESTGQSTCPLTGKPERELIEKSDVSGETVSVKHTENGTQESVAIDDCNRRDTLTDEEKQRYDTEPVDNDDSQSQGMDKLHNEQTFCTSSQLDGNPALYSSSDPGQMRNNDNSINDGLWSQDIAELGLHGSGIGSTEVVPSDTQSASGHDGSSSPSQSVHDTTLSLFNISLLSPLSESTDISVHIEESQCILVDGQRRWKCLMCPKIYSSKHNLVTHIFGHNGIKPHCCQICGKLFKQTSHLQTHALTHTNVKPYSCQVCGRAFSQASHVKRHMAVHMERRPHVCPLCDRGFVYPSELKAHHDKHKHGKGNMCEDCGDTFESTRRLKQHKATVHKDVSDVTCGVCGKVFTYPSQLRDHMLKHGGKRPYMCTECGMDFMKEHHLRAHQFTHTGLKPFKCGTCHRSFNQKANLQRHQLIHQNQRRYRCNICGRDFSQPQVLKAHLVTHSSKKPHECHICGKQFSRLHNLNGHVHMHKGTKPHVCSCGASFTLKGNLNRHCKEKHGQHVSATDAAALGTEETDSTAERNDEGFLLVPPTHTAVPRTSNEDSLESTTDNTSVPKKKHRKSMPRKKIISQNGDVEDEEIEAAWRDENAVDELPADPSRSLTDPTVVIPARKKLADVGENVRNVQLIGEVKVPKTASQAVDADCITTPCYVPIQRNIEDVHVDCCTLVGKKRKYSVVSVSKMESNNSTTVKKTKKESETVVEKRVGTRRRSRKQVSYCEDDLDYSDDIEGLTPGSDDPEWATAFSGSVKHGSETKKPTRTSNNESNDQSKSCYRLCSTSAGTQCCRKESVCDLGGSKQNSERNGTNGGDCSASKMSGGGNKPSLGMAKKRGPRIGKKASLIALMAARQQLEKCEH